MHLLTNSNFFNNILPFIFILIISIFHLIDKKKIDNAIEKGLSVKSNPLISITLLCWIILWIINYPNGGLWSFHLTNIVSLAFIIMQYTRGVVLKIEGDNNKSVTTLVIGIILSCLPVLHYVSIASSVAYLLKSKKRIAVEAVFAKEKAEQIAKKINR